MQKFIDEGRERLDKLEDTIQFGFQGLERAINRQTDAIKATRAELLAPAIGKDRVPIRVFLVVVVAMSALFLIDKAYQTNKKIGFSNGKLQIENDPVSKALRE